MVCHEQIASLSDSSKQWVENHPVTEKETCQLLTLFQVSLLLLPLHFRHQIISWLSNFFTKNANNHYKEKTTIRDSESTQPWFDWEVVIHRVIQTKKIEIWTWPHMKNKTKKYWLHLLKNKGDHQPLGDKILHIYMSTKQTSPMDFFFFFF